MRTIYSIYLLVAALLCPVVLSAKHDKPNVIILFTDDQGYGDVGCYGNDEIPTPYLDEMAKSGMRFTDFYVAAASCTPSRASLMTGCYPQRVGLPAVVDDLSAIGLNPNEHTIAEYLSDNGYVTGMFGKWHLGFQPEFMPLQHGFSEFYGIPYSMDMWPHHPKPVHQYPDLPLYDNEEVVAYNPDVNSMTTLFTEHTVDFIKTHKDEPFFVYLPYSQPHVPLGVSEKFKGKSSQGLYGDCVMEIDWSVGQILAALESCDLSENTLVLFSSDNGPWLSYGNHAGSAGALREGKGSTFEGGQRVPFIATMPGTIPANSECHELATAMDILPTVMTMIGVDFKAQLPIDGKDITPLLLAQDGAVSPHDAFFFVNKGDVEAVRSGKWKLHVPHLYRIVNAFGVDGMPGDQDNYGGQIALALYDVVSDPSETKNLASEYPQIVKVLTKQLLDFRYDLRRNSRAPGRVQ